MTESERSKEKKVLLIDDSKSARRVTTAHLSAAGLTVITASDGFAALADVVEHEPHIVVADIVMPRLDGYQTCALLKRNPVYQAIPVILVSSRDGVFDRARGRLVGADAHLAKPFTETELLSTITQCLESDTPASSTKEPADADRLDTELADETMNITQVVTPI